MTAKTDPGARKKVKLWVFASRWTRNEGTWFLCDNRVKAVAVADRAERLRLGADCGPIVRVEVPRG